MIVATPTRLTPGKASEIYRVVLFAAAIAIGGGVALEGVPAQEPSLDPSESRLRTAIFAGGCFWCVESDFEKLSGVSRVVSGYTGGRSKHPQYQNYAAAGHREAIFVVYDPSRITYAGLVEYFLKHIDPTDRSGQFRDRGRQYSPAIYYGNAEEKAAAERVLNAIREMDVFRGKKIVVAVEPRQPFWPAEEYHQDYHLTNALKYSLYRTASGRDAFLATHWGQRASVLELPGALPEETEAVEGDRGAIQRARQKWANFRKLSPVELKKRLTAMQYKVTQEDGTEPAYRNPYWDNKHEGIYVDVVSGEPLFSSRDKYDSGTGWPSFVQPITPDAVVYRLDRKLFVVRTEVRSRFADSHLGHVFDDGPPDRGGKRYCMNSAALRFVPKERMEAEGYGEFLRLFETDSEPPQSQLSNAASAPSAPRDR